MTTQNVWEANRKRLTVRQRLGHLALWLGAMLTVSSLTTQWVASQAHYHPRLGPRFLGWFPPWAWLDWYEKYYNQAPDTFNTAGGGFALGLGGIVLALAAWSQHQRRKRSVFDGIHGTAQWADTDDIQASGLLPYEDQPGQGVYVGAWRDKRGTIRYLRHNGPEHIAAIAPTRSGKGVGLVIPSLLSWPHSVVVNDMKGELWALTAAYRKHDLKNVVLKFDPAASEGSCRFNPLGEVRLNTLFEVSDVQNLVTILVDPDGKGLEDHWAKTAHAFLTGVILHLLHLQRDDPTPASLANVANALSDPEKPIDKLYEEMIQNTHEKGKTRHPVVAAAGRDMLNRPEQERGSVLSTAMSFLSLYRDPLIANNTACSDFRIRDLMHHTAPVSLFLVVKPSDKDRLKPLMRLIINQIIRILVGEDLKFVEGQPEASYNHRLLLMLDEFPSYGRLEIFQEALAYIAGYGIKAYLIMQDISQLQGAYGREESILSNCHIRVAYAPNKVETAEWLSRSVGQTTVVVKDETRSGKHGSIYLEGLSRHDVAIARPLLTPDECMRLKAPQKDKEGRITSPGDVLVFVSGHRPIYGTQILYFQDPWFREQAGLGHVETDRISSSKIVGKPFSCTDVPEPAISNL